MELSATIPQTCNCTEDPLNRVELSAPVSLRSYVLTAFFGAVAAAGGYLLMAIPNVEVFTLLLFVAGYSVGTGRGVIAACAASFLYFGLNPQGGFFPPLLISQMIGAALAPLAGAMFRRTRQRGWITAILCGIAGLLTTFGYDLITNLAYPFTAGFDYEQVIATLVLGIPFAALHIGSNLLIFFFLAPPLLTLADKHHWRE